MSTRRRIGRLAASLVLLGCIARGRGGGSGDPGIDREREITDRVAEQIRAGAPLITDPVLLAYVNELGQSIVRVTEPQPFLYRFAIVRDDSLNAFTIGGGHVYVNSGVIARAGSASELAGVLAHEIAHVRERHIVKRSEGQGITTLATLAAAAAAAMGGVDPGVLVLAQSLNVTMQLRNSREAESEADREGLGYMVRAGWQPEGMVRFFERIVAASNERSLAPSYLFTHPAVDERILDTRSLLSRMERPASLRINDPRLAALQDRLAMLQQPVAGGSGLLARARFDASRTDPLLSASAYAQSAGDRTRADELLAEAEELEPGDPRVAMARAGLAEAGGDLAKALVQLRRAYAIDPTVPLVQLQLGDLLRRLGSRGEAIFYLEQAAANLSAGSSLQKRAESLLRTLPFPPLTESAWSGRDRADVRVARGDRIVWEGRVGERFADRPARVRWLAPDGSTQSEGDAEKLGEQRLRASLDTEALSAGSWTLVVLIGDVVAERRSFRIVEVEPEERDQRGASPRP